MVVHLFSELPVCLILVYRLVINVNNLNDNNIDDDFQQRFFNLNEFLYANLYEFLSVLYLNRSTDYHYYGH